MTLGRLRVEWLRHDHYKPKSERSWKELTGFQLSSARKFFPCAGIRWSKNVWFGSHYARRGPFLIIGVAKK